MEGLACAGVGPGPDRHGQEHDVHRAEARHRQRPDEARLFGILRILLRREQVGLVADAAQGTDQVRRPAVGSVPSDDDALCRQVDPGRLDAGLLPQRPLHRRDAGGALHPGHRQVALACAVAEIAAGQPDLLQRRLGVTHALDVRTNGDGSATVHRRLWPALSCRDRISAWLGRRARWHVPTAERSR